MVRKLKPRAKLDRPTTSRGRKRKEPTRLGENGHQNKGSILNLFETTLTIRGICRNNCVGRYCCLEATRRNLCWSSCRMHSSVKFGLCFQLRNKHGKAYLCPSVPFPGLYSTPPVLWRVYSSP